MSGQDDACEAAKAEAMHAAEALRAIQPNHELLRLVGGRDWDKAGGISDDDLSRWTRERIERFYMKRSTLGVAPAMLGVEVYSCLTAALYYAIYDETPSTVE